MAKKPKVMFDITYVDDLLVFNEKEVFTYVIVEGQNMGAPTQQEISEQIRLSTVALEKFKETDCHYYIATRAFDSATYLSKALARQEQRTRATGNKPAPAYRQYMADAAARIQAVGYKQYTRYLGVKLGNRVSRMDKMFGHHDGATKKIISKFYKGATESIGAVDPVPTEAEVRKWAAKAHRVRAQLGSSSALRARGATAADMWEWVWHMMTLGTNCPIPPGRKNIKSWGSGALRDAVSVLDTRDPLHLSLMVENPHLIPQYEAYQIAKKNYEAAPESNPRPVKPSARLVSAVVATSVQLPDFIDVPWIDEATTGNESVDVSIRYRVKSKATALKEAQAIVSSLEKEANHQREHNSLTEATKLSLYKAQEHAAAIETGAAESQISATCRMLVHGGESEQVLLDAKKVQSRFEESVDTQIQWLRDTQALFFLESVPGSLKRSKIHEFSGDLRIITEGMPFAARYIGHMQDGFYMGSFGQQPWIVDPTRLAMQGKAPTFIYNSKLGGGKTSSGMQMLDIFRLIGAYSIVVDPKGDFRSHCALPGRGHLRYWEIGRNGRSGMFDPFTMTDLTIDPNDEQRDTPEKARKKWEEETKEIVQDTIERCFQGIISVDQHKILMELIKEEMKMAKPSMASLLKRFERGEYGSILNVVENPTEERISHYKLESRAIFTYLESAKNSTYGHLIFGERETEDAGLIIKGVNTTIVNVSGLNLPSEGAAPEGMAQRLSVTLLSLLFSYAVKQLKNPNIKGAKGLFVDEVNVIKHTPAFRTAAADVNSQARSLSINPHYFDQSSSSSMDKTLFANKIGARFVFRSDLDEREEISAALGRKNYEISALAAAMPDGQSSPGTAFVAMESDADSSFPNVQSLGVVRFDRNWRPEYVDAFETNDEQIEGFVRAAYRKYPFDSNGILHDPFADPLEVVELYADSPESFEEDTFEMETEDELAEAFF